MTRVYQAGETVEVYAEVKDQNGNLVNPTTITVAINSPSGEEVIPATSMSQIDTGKYNYYYRSKADDEKGWWKARVVVTDGMGSGALTTITDGGFQLE